MSMKGNRIYTGAAGKISTNRRSNWFLKIDTEVPAICSSISRHEQKRHRSCDEDDLVLAVIGRCALVARLGVGGERNQTGLGQLHLRKIWRPGWGQLVGGCVPVRRGWIGEAFPHRPRDLSLSVFQSVGPSPVGLHQPPVLGRWLPLHTPGVAALRHSRTG